MLTSPIVLVGCANAIQSGHGTALDSFDLDETSSRMTASILASPQVREAIAREGPLRVVVERVENRMTGEILPRPEAEAFTARIRLALAEHAPDQFVWCLNRETFERLRGSELDNVRGPSPDRVHPRYVLWGHFHSLTHEDSRIRRSSYLCLFELTDLNRSTTLWSGRYEVSKRAVKGMFD
jgi:hypothetical protein